MPFLLPALVSFLLLISSVWTGVTAFTEGEFPFSDWKTRYVEWFGFAWVASAAVILLPCYLAAIGLGFFAWTVREEPDAHERRFHWWMAVAMTLFLVLLTFGVRVMVTAWFPVPMHPPFDELSGGPGMGFLVFVILSLAVLAFDRVVRRLSPYRGGRPGGGR